MAYYMRLWFKILLLLTCITKSQTVSAQAGNPKYKIELKMLERKCVLTKESPNIARLRLVVSVTNLTGDTKNTIRDIRYSYKKYKEQDFYMEATDLNGKKVEIDGDDDIDYIVDPLGDRPGVGYGEFKTTDTEVVSIYKFKRGKYLVRWVYDPANNDLAGKRPSEQPVYSNWEMIEVVDKRR